MNKTSSYQAGGYGALQILGIVLITLKFTGYIHWSWWWVTSPFWGGLLLFLPLLGISISVDAICKRGNSDGA